jgi:hypothetical protein
MVGEAEGHGTRDFLVDQTMPGAMISQIRDERRANLQHLGQR